MSTPRKRPRGPREIRRPNNETIVQIILTNKTIVHILPTMPDIPMKSFAIGVIAGLIAAMFSTGAHAGALSDPADPPISLTLPVRFGLNSSASLDLSGSRDSSDFLDSSDSFDSVGEGRWVWELRSGAWIADWDFTAITATTGYNVEGKVLGFLSPATEIRFTEHFSVEAAYVYNIGGDISAHVVSAGLAFKLFPPEPLDEQYERFVVNAGLCYGTIDIGVSDFPGDFDNAVGFYGGIQYIVELGERFEFNIGLQVRSLEFDFNPDADVIVADGSIGGLGAVTSLHLFGLSWKF